MKFFPISFTLAASSILVAAAPNIPLIRRDVDPGLVPQFGHQAGLNPTGTGDCDGITNAAGKVVKIPCFCPPDRAVFLQSLNANVAAGRVVNNSVIAVSFPTGTDKASRLARMNTAIVTLQNFRGPGVGCPAASTTFSAQLKAIQNGTGTSVSQSPASSSVSTSPIPSSVSTSSVSSSVSTLPASSSIPASPAPSRGVDPALVPEFGHQAGLNPTGTGDCDGIANAAGKVVKVPCFCPPERGAFIEALNANVAAGDAVNNTRITVSFPPGNDKASKLARISAALVTLQNFRGPGVGCPASSTTFVAQQKAIQNS